MATEKRSLRERATNPLYVPLIATALFAGLTGALLAGGPVGASVTVVIGVVVVSGLIGLALPPFNPPDDRRFRLFMMPGMALAALVIVLLAVVS